MRRPLAQWEREGFERLPAMVRDYYQGGSRDERTLTWNRWAWDQVFALRHRVLVDVSAVDLQTTLLGRVRPTPFVVAPTAFHGLAHPDAELATARGAREAGVPMVLSTLSNTPMEAVAEAAGSCWFQLYVTRDRGATRAMVARAAAAGCEALVLTVDAPRLGTRERDDRAGFHLPAHLTLPNAAPDGRTVPAVESGSGLAAYVARQLDPSLSWRDLDQLVASTSLPVLLKGVMHPDDARRACDHGAAGVVVSNHGGRQLDGELPTALALEEVVDAVGDRLEVHVDGGLRRGTHAAVALALGARAVGFGRPILAGLSAEGQAGVHAVLTQAKLELEEAMALLGAPDARHLDRSLLSRLPAGRGGPPGTSAGWR